MVRYDYKDSDIEWLGKIPKHWKTTPIKKEFTVIPSNVDKKSFDEETEVKLCNYVDVYYNDFLDSSIDYMVATATEGEIGKFKLEVNDVLITKDSEDPYDIAVPAIITEIQDVITSYSIHYTKLYEASLPLLVKSILLFLQMAIQLMFLL